MPSAFKKRLGMGLIIPLLDGGNVNEDTPYLLLFIDNVNMLLL